MRTFTLFLHGTTQYECIPNVRSFVAQDASGSFGIQADHARMLACLDFGLARFRMNDDSWEYLALPGGVLYFRENQLRLSTRSYLRHHDFRRVSAALHERFKAEEEGLREIKEGLARLERDMLRRLAEAVQRGEPVL